MATINIRIDDALKIKAFSTLEALGVKPSDLIRQTLEYVAESGKIPFKQAVLSEDETHLIETVRQRLGNPEPVRVSLNDL